MKRTSFLTSRTLTPSSGVTPERYAALERGDRIYFLHDTVVDGFAVECRVVGRRSDDSLDLRSISTGAIYRVSPARLDLLILPVEPEPLADLHDAALVAISRWIDESPGYDGCSPETVHWRRVSKIAAEAGEALDALGGWVGENPRKGVTNDLQKVLDEILDVATAALGAYEHLTDHQGEAREALDRHILRVARRAGVMQTEPKETNDG